MKRVILIVLVACVGTAALAGCGEETIARDQVVTLTQVETRTVAPPAEAADMPASGAAGAETNRRAASRGEGITVPDVVGRDHQFAQDTMQAAGLYNLAEEDATGQGRALLWDRNWVVVSQSPPAGSRVNADTTIVLRSKKDGE